MNTWTVIGVVGLFAVSNFIWYWQGVKDGKREGYTLGRSINRGQVQNAR